MEIIMKPSSFTRFGYAIFLGCLTNATFLNLIFANPEAVGFVFSTDTRIGAQAGYFRHYVPSENYAATMAFTGDVNASNPGTVSATHLADCQRRVNYYRVQAGLPGDIIFTPAKNAKSQWAALIMSNEGNLSHQPAIDFPGNASVIADKAAHGGNGWGNEAAGEGNLSLGTYGPGAVSSFIVDGGLGNEEAGHRRWLLNPAASEMGMGSIPPQGNYWESSSIWVIGDFKPPSAATTKLVPWPNAGFIPYSQVPNPVNTANEDGLMRWSCAYTKGNFANATVSMTRTSGAGAPAAVPVTKEPYATGSADNAIVWKINNGSSLVVPTATQDISYSIVISGIVLTAGSPPVGFVTSGSTYQYAYTVTTFDENSLTTPMTVTGPASPLVGLTNAYVLNQLPESSGVRVRAGSLSAATWTEGAEDPAPSTIIDGPTAYTLRQGAPGPVAAGSKAFHLAIPSLDAPLQSFTIARDFIPSATSRLQFKNRFRFLTTATSLNVEASTNGGTQWNRIWSRNGFTDSGNSSSWETTFQTVDSATALAAYVGKIVRLRFTLSVPRSGPAFEGVSTNHGAFIDAITVTNAQDFSTLSTTELAPSASTYHFTPPAAGTYSLASQMELGDTQWFAYGPLTTVTAVAPAAIQTWRNAHFGSALNSGISADTVDADLDGLPNLVEFAFGLNPASAQVTSANLPTVIRSGSNLIFSFKPDASATGLTYTVQKSPTMQDGSWTPVPHSIAPGTGVYSASVPVSGPRLMLRLQVANQTGL